MPLIYGTHLRSFLLDFDDKAPLDERTKVGWTGPTANGQTIRLFLSSWKNPNPEVAIESLDFMTSTNRITAFLFAITAER